MDINANQINNCSNAVAKALDFAMKSGAFGLNEWALLKEASEGIFTLMEFNSQVLPDLVKEAEATRKACAELLEAKDKEVGEAQNRLYELQVKYNEVHEVAHPVNSNPIPVEGLPVCEMIAVAPIQKTKKSKKA